MRGVVARGELERESGFQKQGGPNTGFRIPNDFQSGTTFGCDSHV